MQVKSRSSLFFVWLILVLLSIALFTATPRILFANESEQLASELSVTSRWQQYVDNEYGFTLEYPLDWEVTILVEQTLPYPEPQKIVRKYAFAGDDGYVTLSLFLTQGLELVTWLESYSRSSPALFPVMDANTKVSGHPAVVFITGDNLILFMSNGEYVYRFWHPLTTNVSAVQVNWHMLNTFHTLNSTSIDTGVEIPQSIMDEVYSILETMGKQVSTCTNEVYKGCCELPAMSACNRFPCSLTSGGKQLGNCTYYVCYRYGGVPFSGNAREWWRQVPSTPGWHRHWTPPTGSSIAWWNTGDYGHVGVIGLYSGSGTPLVDEQNYCISCTRTRAVWAHGYIQRGQPTPVPTIDLDYTQNMVLIPQ